jgi:protein-L-isoaspartate(D-aspartate) O-methyltransferase
MVRTVVVVGAVVAWTVTACDSTKENARDRDRDPDQAEVVLVPLERPAPDPYEAVRNRMVDDTIVARGVRDPRTIEAMRRVPRHRFVPPEVRDEAYADHALPIGYGLTISQPYIVAVMTEAAKVDPGDKVLEIGTGSGYQAAVLRAIGAKVYTIEIVEPLAERTRKVFTKHSLDIELAVGDGYHGWPDAAPFDAIIVTAAAPSVPQPLLEQLAIGGRIVIPVGDDVSQQLRVVTRSRGSYDEDELFGVRFGPMTGDGVTGK